jgi:hypothetical protein
MNTKLLMNAISILLATLLVMGGFNVLSFAAEPDYQVRIQGRLDIKLQYEGRDTYTIAFQIKTENGKTIAKAQSLSLVYDTDLFDLVKTKEVLNSTDAFTIDTIPSNDWLVMNDWVADHEPNQDPPSASTLKAMHIGDYATAYTGWTPSLRLRKSETGKLGYLYIEPYRFADIRENGTDPEPAGLTLPDYESMQIIMLAFKQGKSFNDMRSDSIQYLSDDLKPTCVAYSVCVFNGTDQFYYGTAMEGQTNTLNVPIWDFQMPGGSVFRVDGAVSSYDPKRLTNIRLYNDVKEYKIPINEQPGRGLVTQPFTISGVDSGTYTLEITKDAHLKYTIRNVIVGDFDLDLSTDIRPGVRDIVLVCGDINGDGQIDSGDLSIFLDNFGKSGLAIINPLTDLNGDGQVDYGDLSIFIDGFGKWNTIIS